MPARKPPNDELADLLKTLGHPDRVRLVAALREDEKDVQTLSESLGVRQARVSQHLAVLRAGRVVEDRREGRHVLYRLARPALAAWLVVGGLALAQGTAEAGAEEFAAEEARVVLAESEAESKKRGKK